MRVLQMHTRYREAGGEDVVVGAERELLLGGGHDVRQHLVDNPARALPATAALLGSAWNLIAARRAASVRASFEPDVVHVHNTWFALSPASVAAVRADGTQVVMTVHNYRLMCANGLFLRDGVACEDCLQHSFVNAVRHRCYRGSRTLSAVAAGGIALHNEISTWARVVDRFIVLSRFAEQRLVQAGYPEDRIEVGSNFVADPGPRQEPPSASETVTFVGRLSPEKGVGHLLEAWRRTAPSTLRLRIVGDGPLRRGLEESAPPGVEFLGRLDHDDTLRQIRSSRALVVPSLWYEGQPMVALEAMARGTPLLVSHIGALPELLGHEQQGGWTLRPGDPDDIAAHIRLIEHEPEEVDHRGRQARLRYLRVFTPTSALKRLEGTYQRARADL